MIQNGMMQIILRTIGCFSGKSGRNGYGMLQSSFGIESVAALEPIAQFSSDRSMLPISHSIRKFSRRWMQAKLQDWGVVKPTCDPYYERQKNKYLSMIKQYKLIADQIVEYGTTLNQLIVQSDQFENSVLSIVDPIRSAEAAKTTTDSAASVNGDALSLAISVERVAKKMESYRYLFEQRRRKQLDYDLFLRQRQKIMRHSPESDIHRTKLEKLNRKVAEAKTAMDAITKKIYRVVRHFESQRDRTQYNMRKIVKKEAFISQQTQKVG